MKGQSRDTSFGQYPPLTHVMRDEEPRRETKDVKVFRLLLRVFRFAMPHRLLLGKLTAMVLLRSALLPMLAWAIGAVINGPIEAGDAAGILWGALGFAGLAAFTQASFHFRMRYALQLGETVVHDLRNALFSHLMRQTMAYYDRTKVGRIIGRITSDVDSVRAGVQDIVFVSAVQGGQMVVTACMMLYYDPVLFGVVAAIAPVILVLNRQFKRRIGDAQRKTQESFTRVTATLAESVSGVRVTQGFVREDINAEFFRELVLDHSRYNVGAARTTAVFLPLLELNSQFFVALLLVVGGWRVLHGDAVAQAGDIVRFFFLANLFFDPIRMIGNQYNNALAAMVGAERVFRLLDLEPEWDDAPGATALDSPSADVADGGTFGCRVEFRDLSFGYKPDRPVLHGIRFVAEPGQSVALVGHTGSGKTSITSLIAKFYLPTAGAIFVDGHEIRNIDTRSLHACMGIVTQQTFLFEGTVLDNIRYSRRNATVQEVIGCVRQLGFLDMIESLPGGFRTEVGENGTNLSSGQRQLVSFARALLVNPRLLILDEATSAVDAITEARIQHALATLLQGRTSFVVAHRLSTIRSANLILVLRDGEIIERGTHAELLALGGVYSSMHQQFVKGGEG